MNTITFAIEGMHCEGCAETIQACLCAAPGVKAAAVSFEKRSADVTFDAAETSAERLAALIEKAGFRATPLGGSP